MENKDSKDILPTKFAKWATKNNWKWDDYLGTNVWWKYNPDSMFRKERTTDELWEIFLKEMNIEANQDLESSEERVKQLEEENTRLKGLLPDCFEAGARNKMKPFTTDLCGEDCPNFEDWCKKNNIKL